ncbi:acyl-CoA thioester hydrolase, YbgC/YbaW family [Desulfocapsa sulfexigens DSM 10523]|uniref:Acyl-CoA thioester hydrolase, YbgC/YbaW family n=1 Tax=Desulfocapsa sulfexigens (strain DSM 10523 / SB164P1) TaxID=1167006 RepID=M1PKP1_DESSD|nr:thioesterase family protein [Desulfocapsa sulfexigens]AGF77041.1 acyl-CoA thioester hydrolase, YbgC/YbaW family [Desulfocapsa sulfexigens DSM 10523]
MINEAAHRTPYRVIYGDTDAAAVVYNANYLRFFEIGRTELMREKVCSYRDIEELGLLLPVTECFVRYKAFARYDDLLQIETKLVWIKKVSCKFSYRLLREEPGAEKETLIAKGHTIHAAVNRDGKLTPIPTEIAHRLQALLPPSE